MKKSLILTIIAVVAISIFMVGREYINLQYIIANYEHINQFINDNQKMAYTIFFVVYALLVAFSLPLASVLTIGSGIFFEPWTALVLVVTSATFGAGILYWVVEHIITQKQRQFIDGVLQKMKGEMDKNMLSYLFFLRLTPVFPFWAVNLALAIYPVPFRLYFITTLLGIIPGTYIFITTTSLLRDVLISAENPSVPTLSTGDFWELIALGGFALLPIILKKIKNWSKKS